MAAQSNIEWTDSTFNPWEGCQKVGPGCDHCYAENRNARFAGGQAINWGPGAPRRLTSASNWAKPLAWNRAHQAFFADHGRRRRVFCASLADVFDNAVPAQWRISLLRLIEQTPHLDWLLLTKRIGNAADMLEVAMRAITAGREGWRDNYFPHVAIGATVVNQEEAYRDIPKLLATPASVRFLSMEPLLGPVDVRFAFANPAVLHCHVCGFSTNRWAYEPCPNDGEQLRGDIGIDWVIVGGESGAGARPMQPDWVRSLRDQCEAAGTPFLFKQWGEHAPARTSGPPLESDVQRLGDHPVWVGKKAAGRLLDGRTHDGFPTA